MEYKRFRSQTVNPIMEKSLDILFNYPIFTTTHEMYTKMLFYTSDDIYTMWWDGHEGGVEGQNTDTWLYCYIQQIKSSLDKYSLPYHLLGRGDDMRIFVLIPPQYLEVRSMEDIRSELMKNLSTDMVGFNQHIKVDDCYSSEVYFAFGKVSSLYTVELPTAFRKISQCYGANNAFIPLLDDYIGSSLSNAHSSSKSCCNPGHCYLVGLIWTYYYILTTPGYYKCTDDEFVALSLIPSLLGGFPIIFLHNMYVRAESDLFSPFLSIMMFCKSKYLGLYQVIRLFLYIKRQKKVNYTILLKDRSSAYRK